MTSIPNQVASMISDHNEICKKLKALSLPLVFSNFNDDLKDYLIEAAPYLVSKLNIKIEELTIEHFQTLLNDYCKKNNL